MNRGTQQRDTERIRRITGALERANIDALVCALPANVLLVSGYWPVIGTSVAVITRAGFVYVLAPNDEAELAHASYADVVETFAFGSLSDLRTPVDVLDAPLTSILREIEPRRALVVGCESGPTVEPASYVGMQLFGGAIDQLLVESLGDEVIVSADELLSELRAVLSVSEQERVRVACAVAERAFVKGAERLHVGMHEREVAALFRASLAVPADCADDAARMDGFMFCMSGPNSTAAYAAYQRSRARQIAVGDLVLVHCNSYVDGYWTDVTRTFCAGAVDERKRRMYDAIFAARDAALETIRPGVKAADVDRAARNVLSERGFAKEFRHGLGHGVGFAAINHNGQPRLHPVSNDVLQAGMIFNIEPAIYIDGFGGLRHCDMVLLTDRGPELLTPFQATLESLTIL